MNDVIAFLVNTDWAQVSQALLMILGGASILAKLTPTKWDDNIIAKIINILGLTKKVK